MYINKLKKQRGYVNRKDQDNVKTPYFTQNID